MPVMPLFPTPRKPGVEWTAVSRSALRFLGVMHAFRWATEDDTRAGGIGWGRRYFRSVSNLHGWADGDPFYTNFLGHPAQGSVAGRLFSNHDLRYRNVEFGRDPDYWKGRLRAAAFSFAFSEQFEIGLLSEASLGHIQNRFPQQGFVDHVITPTVGMGFTVAEDAVDRYFIRPMEARVHNKWARLALRTGLNPTRSFANLLDRKAPWHRDTRPGILEGQPAPESHLLVRASSEPKPPVAPFEFSVSSGYRKFASGPCVGGGAEAAYRVASEWQVVLGVNGCNLSGLPKNVSGDALVYQVGPRWTPLPSAKWSPYVELLVGGVKVTHEELFPDRKKAIQLAFPNAESDPDFAHQLHDKYTSSEEANGLAIAAGTGIDYKLNNALAFRVAGLEYSRSTLRSLGGMSYQRGLQFSTGMVLRLGTW